MTAESRQQIFFQCPLKTPGAKPPVRFEFWYGATICSVKISVFANSPNWALVAHWRCLELMGRVFAVNHQFVRCKNENQIENCWNRTFSPFFICGAKIAATHCLLNRSNALKTAEKQMNPTREKVLSQRESESWRRYPFTSQPQTIFVKKRIIEKWPPKTVQKTKELKM